MHADSLSSRTVASFIIGSLIFPVALVLTVNLYLDPFELFSIDRKSPNVLLGGRGKDRYQHAGTLRQHKPNSVIVGNSYAANFLPTHIEEELGWKRVFSITLDGSSLHEQSRVLNFGLRQSKIEDVLWLLAPEIFSAPFDYLYPKLPFPAYLYNTFQLDDLKLYTTLPKTIYQHSLDRAVKLEKINKEASRIGSPIDPRDRSTEWFSLHHKKFGNPQQVAMRIFKKAKISQQDLDPIISTKALSVTVIEAGNMSKVRHVNFHQNLEHNIIPLVSHYPRVKFTFVIHPPFPLLHWQHLKATQALEYLDRLLTVRQFVNAMSAYPNVSVYGFGMSAHAWDLSMYKDATHYHPSVNADMTAKISQGIGLLNHTNIIAYLKQFDTVVTEYRPAQSPRSIK